MERWKSNLYTLWVSQVVSLMSFGFGLPFIPFYIQTLGVTDPVALKFFSGVLSAAPAITMAVMAPIWGMLSDRYGRKIMIQRATFAATFLLILMGCVQNVWQLVFLRLLQGVFTGTIVASSAFVASNTPDENMSFALGFLSSSTFVGYSFGPLIGGVVAEFYGYRVSFFVGAVLMFFGFLIVTLKLVEDKNSFGQISATKSDGKKGKMTAILTQTIVLLLIMLFLQRIVRTVFSPFLPLYIQEQLNSLEGASSTTGILNGVIGLVTALSAIVISRLGDLYDKIKIIQILMILALVDVVVLNSLSGWWGFVIPYTLMFFIIGGIEPLMTSMSAQQVTSDKRGLLFGIQGLIGSLGWLVSPTLGTWISIEFGIFRVLIVILAAVVLNTIFSFYIGYRQRQRT
ncbi:MFS transporter [Fusibacter paucivorans]|uniref:MFS transporter n=1 Tax=Fusibacter paucivorans TaxID=76009 RepID=A0ABS5PQE0_9FIRM|nr:MFS transporter [Fusibacter paucivorans]MBS7526624.1 MFS transporter [Fusibacter paucivorans]